MKNFLKRIIKQYITCKHTDYDVIRKIMCPDNRPKTKWMEKCKCKECGRIYYSDYFYEYGKERHYVKN
jgi:hypothetical protein